MSGFLAAGWTRRCVFALAILSSFVSVRAEEDTAPQALFPPETYLFISCPSVDDMKERFAETSMGKLWNDRSMSGVRDEVQKHVDEFASQVKDHVGIPFADLLALPSGEISLGVSKVQNKLAGALIIDVGDHTDTLKKVIGKINSALSEKGTKSTETYEEIELSIYKPKEGTGPDLVLFSDESYFVFTTGVPMAKAIIDRWDGKHEKTLGKSPYLTTIFEECEESEDAFSDLYFYVEPINLALEAMKLDPRSAGNAAMAQGFLPLLGLDKLKAIGGAVSLESDDYDTVSRTMFYVDQPLGGILSIFRMPATLDGPPAWVGKNVDQYSGFTWDVPGAYKAVDTLVGTFAPQLGGLDGLLDQVANNPGNPGIHPKKDLLDQLTGTVHVISVEKEGAEPKMLFAVGVKDEKAVANVFEKVSAQVPNLKPRMFEGVRVYDVDTQGDSAPAMAVTRGSLFIATDPSALEAAIRGKSVAEEPLSGAEDYKNVAEHFPKPASSIGFARPAAQIKSVWNMAKSGQFTDELHGLDLTKLPEFDSVKKYFSPSGSYIAPHEKGAVMVNFSLPVE